MHSLFNYVIPKEKNILNSASMDRALRATCYTQQYPFQPNELAPLQGWLLPIFHGEKTWGLRWKPLKVLAPCPVACCPSRLRSSGKQKGSVWPWVRLKESGARAALALGVLTKSARNGMSGFSFQEIRTQNMPLSVSWLECIQRQCQLGTCWPQWKREETRRDEQPQEEVLLDVTASTSRTSWPK